MFKKEIKHLSESHKRKIGETMKGKKHTEEWKRKMSERLKGNKYSLNKIPWNKGTVGICKPNLGSFEKGKHYSLKTEFKKGIISWSKGKHWKVSKQGRKNIANGHKGEKAYNWKGGIETENRRIRHSLEFHLWREAVFARDNWTCQKCFEKGRYIHPHHIFNFATYLDLRFAIDNGITFCKDCHEKFHKIYGKKNNTKEQLDEFLSSTKVS